MQDLPFRTSFWFDEKIATREPLRQDTLTDVVIIGGGFAGLSSAYHLRQADPTIRIALIESKHIGFGASGRAAGWLMNLPPALWMLANLGDPQTLDDIRFTVGIVEENISEIGQLVQSENIECNWTETMHTLVARNPIEDATIKWIAPRFRRVGLEAHLLTATETNARVSYCAKSALQFPMRSVQPYRLARGLHDWLLAHGVTIYENTHIEKIGNRPGGVTVTTKQGYSVTAQYAIIATNAYTKQLQLPTQKPKGQITHTYMIATEQLDDDLISQISKTTTPFGDPALSFFIGRIYDNRLLFNGVDRASHNTTADDRHYPSYQTVYREMLRRFPFLRDIQLDAAWGGAVQETNTEAPIIQRTPENPRLILNVGYGGGSGIGMALVSGRLTTALIMEQTRNDVDALRLKALFDQSQFSLMQPIRAVAGVAQHLFVS